jgi:hypothetical protein
MRWLGNLAVGLAIMGENPNNEFGREPETKYVYMPVRPDMRN